MDNKNDEIVGEVGKIICVPFMISGGENQVVDGIGNDCDLFCVFMEFTLGKS